MKKILCAALALAMLMLCGAALAEECQYAGQGSPCEIKWWVDTEARQHCRACFTHVEIKEDMDSHVPITEWTDCTLDEGGQCTGCGWDYERDTDPGELPDEELAIWMLEMYMWYMEENGIPPVQTTVSGNKLTVKLVSGYFDLLDEMGIPYGESIMVATTYTLTMPNGLNYPYEDKPVVPAVRLESSEYGPGDWLEDTGLLTFMVMYSDNNAPGTATALVEASLEGGESYTIQQAFTIEDAYVEYCKYGSASSPCDIYWDVDREAMKHRSVCINHVEDKDDPYSYVVLLDWQDCNFFNDGYICDVCKADYTPEQEEEPDYDEAMLEIYYKLLERNGEAPLDITVSGNEMMVGFSEQFFMYMLEYGVPTEEYQEDTSISIWTMDQDYNYASEFPATGEEVRPLVPIESIGRGVVEWLNGQHLIDYGLAAFENNVEPGTALAKVDISFGDGKTYTLVREFTIVAAVEDRIPGDATGNDAIELADAIAILEHVVSGAEINAANADVTGDGNVDLKDVLLILQYVAGWNVSLK